MTTPVDDFLEHYGKKGMRWGVRKDERGLSDVDSALNVKQRSQVKVASSISALASMGMASNASATLFQLQSRFEHLRVVKELQKYAEHSPLVDDAGREAIRQTRSHVVKGLVGSAVGATAISVAVGVVTRRTAKAYFAPLHKVYGDEKPKINRDLKQLSKDIKDGKRPKMTKKQYEAEVTRIVSERLTKDANNAVRPFHELARSQLGTEFNTKNLNIKIEKLPNTDLASKMIIITPTGLKLVKAIKNVSHADEDDILAPDLELFFDYKFGPDGEVIEWSCPTIEIADDLFEGRFDMTEITKKFDPESNLQHGDSVDDFLEHYGTKGMKWGVRKQSKPRPGFMPPVKISRLASIGKKKLKPGDSGFDNPSVPGVRKVPKGSAPPTMKPAWQSSPTKKPSPAPQPLPPGPRSRRGKKERILSEDAAQFRELRVKVKREGLQSLTNKDIEMINKRAELISKHNKAFPKKPSLTVQAANFAIEAALSEVGSKKVVDFLAGPGPDRPEKKQRQADLIDQLLTTGRVIRKATKPAKKN